MVKLKVGDIKSLCLLHLTSTTDSLTDQCVDSNGRPCWSLSYLCYIPHHLSRVAYGWMSASRKLVKAAPANSSPTTAMIDGCTKVDLIRVLIGSPICYPAWSDVADYRVK